jgi:hypothetical protein
LCKQMRKSLFVHSEVRLFWRGKVLKD